MYIVQNVINNMYQFHNKLQIKMNKKIMMKCMKIYKCKQIKNKILWEIIIIMIMEYNHIVQQQKNNQKVNNNNNNKIKHKNNINNSY